MKKFLRLFKDNGMNQRYKTSGSRNNNTIFI